MLLRLRVIELGTGMSAREVWVEDGGCARASVPVSKRTVEDAREIRIGRKDSLHERT